MTGSILLPVGMRRVIVSACFFAFFLSVAGCHRAARETKPEGIPPSASGTSEMQTAAGGETGSCLAPPEEFGLSEETSLPSQEISVPGAVPEGVPGQSPPESRTVTDGQEVSGPDEAETVRSDTQPPVSRREGGGKPHPGEGLGRETHNFRSRADAGPGTIVVARLSEDKAFPKDGPPWARSREELVYRVEFLGITMGYARFTYLGKVLLSGKEVYHLRVRAWTSDLLSVIYPVDDTIDYYLDTETIMPLRQVNRKSRKDDDVVIFDQEKGRIVYRYLKDGTVRKQVDVVPNVYDPVSIAYYFRSREIREEEASRAMYAGRKLYEISARPLGFERIRTGRGEFDTIVVQPVLRREGKVDNKGDLRMWITRDERHLPVRVYAKFHKIRTWTLVGELLPDEQGG